MAKIKRRLKANKSSVGGEKRALLAKKTKLSFYLNKGLSVKDACTLSNVSEYLLGQMRSDPDFEMIIQKCNVNYKNELLEYIEDAASCGTWQAAAWILERKYADEFGKKDTIKHEYEIKMHRFQEAVLEVINGASPQLKNEVINRLKNIDRKSLGNGIGLIQDNRNVIDAELVD